MYIVHTRSLKSLSFEIKKFQHKSQNVEEKFTQYQKLDFNFDNIFKFLIYFLGHVGNGFFYFLFSISMVPN